MTDKTLQNIKSLNIIVKDISCKMGGYVFSFHVREYNSAPYLQIFFNAPCSDSGISQQQICRKWILQYTMSKSEVVRTAYKAATAAYQHECEEEFRYKGVPIYSPHTDVEALVTMRGLDQYGDDVRIENADNPRSLESLVSDISLNKFNVYMRDFIISGDGEGEWHGVLFCVYDVVNEGTIIEGNLNITFVRLIVSALIESFSIDSILNSCVAYGNMIQTSSSSEAIISSTWGMITEDGAKKMYDFLAGKLRG